MYGHFPARPLCSITLASFPPPSGCLLKASYPSPPSPPPPPVFIVCLLSRWWPSGEGISSVLLPLCSQPRARHTVGASRAWVGAGG